MFSKLSLKAKLLMIGLTLSMISLVSSFMIMVNQNSKITELSCQEAEKQGLSELENITHGVYALCQTQQETIHANIGSSLTVANNIVNRMGNIKLDQSTAQWNIVNQFTKEKDTVNLSKFMVGQDWLGQNYNPDIKSPVVDEVEKLVGCTCTIFQRINETGDMLRVCTNVKKLDQTRAIGTYIPRYNPDGTQNPVVKALLSGQTYQGKAFVVNKWYITAYQPISDDKGQVVGATYVGIPIENVKSLRRAVLKTKIGEKGYVFVLNSNGDYVISKNAKRDGENIWNAKDCDGNLITQNLIEKAKQTSKGTVNVVNYPWKNPDDEKALKKIAAVTYFEPWDWIIGVSTYEDEFLAVEKKIATESKAAMTILATMIGIVLAASAVIWLLVANKLASKMQNIIKKVKASTETMTFSSAQLSESSQNLAEGSTQQAAGLEETSSSLEEMASMTKRNADNAQQANKLADEANNATKKANNAMKRMNDAIHDIQNSSSETANIIKVIDEIAFQTNLLALNAAVEAARAGEAGKGFAVVAEEVRNLAMRSAEAAKNTSQMIEDSVKNSDKGVEFVSEVNKSLEEINNSSSKVNDLIEEIAAASSEQSQGIDQINTAVSQMDKITQTNASSAEESASASAQLKSQANEMQNVVMDLIKIVNGNTDQTLNQQKSSTQYSHNCSPSFYDEIIEQKSTNSENTVPANIS